MRLKFFIISVALAILSFINFTIFVVCISGHPPTWIVSTIGVFSIPLALSLIVILFPITFLYFVAAVSPKIFLPEQSVKPLKAIHFINIAMVIVVLFLAYQLAGSILIPLPLTSPATVKYFVYLFIATALPYIWYKLYAGTLLNIKKKLI
jgi:hypothetical protein